MFSGIQEILVLLLIIVALIMVPRLLQRGRQDAAGSSTPVRPRKQWPRSIRFAVVLSAIWLAVSIAYFQPWKANPTLFLLVGILPVAVLWGVIWIKR